MAQPHWARRVGAWSNDAFNDVAIDADGNLFAVGEFGGNIELPGVTLVSNGSLDVMVVKYDPSGELLWARTFGSTGMDRAIKVELTADGHLAVVGQFMGNVDFGGQLLAALGGTQDCFLIKMSQSTGAVVWARRGGSANGVDQPNGVSVGPDGSIAVAGEFRGTAIFDQGTITSITDPQTGQPSVDIFLATYAGDGTPLWLAHGAAAFADRAIDVVHDLDGNVYLTGQFTDTLTLAGNVHNNAMYSAVFIARFSPAGQEEWFRPFGGGTYNQVFEMVLVQGSYLMLVGDVQGTVIFLDSQPDLFTAVAPRSSFLLKVGLDGELIAQKTWGSEHPINTRALSVFDNDVAVLGRFNCQLTGFTAQYGESSFLASGTWDLYVARFQTSDLDFKTAQQFTGLYEKIPGGIAHANDGEAIFCGAFEHGLVFPANDAFNAVPGGALTTAPQEPGYCSDDDYDLYRLLRGSALKDAFIARGYVNGREPHDPYVRYGAGCTRPFRPPAILTNEGAGVHGPDSLSRCNSATLTAYTFTAFMPDTATRHNAPGFQFLWSTGATTASIAVSQSGWYWVDVSLGLQCFSWRDSLYLTIHPQPPLPWINDDVVVNSDAVLGMLVEVCEPQLPWLWATNLDPANAVHWIRPGGVLVHNDSVQAISNGVHIVEVTTPANCWRINTVNVRILPNGPLTPPDIDLISSYPQDVDQNDTLALCVGQSINLVVGAFDANGDPFEMPYGIRSLKRCTPTAPWSENGDANGFLCMYTLETEGWYVHEVGYALTNAPCGEDTLFFFHTDSIYAMPLPVVQPILTATGTAVICPGDTVSVIGTCANCMTTVWVGTGITATSGDTAWVNTPGTYSYTGTAFDPFGCGNAVSEFVSIGWNPLPTLLVEPLDGIICPNDSASIWTNALGGEWQWYGPLGPLSVSNDSIHTSQQGFYYLEMTDTLGCRVTSQPILITDYATPYLTILPDNVLCEPGETSILQVITTSESSLMWQAPFTGSSALQQVVTQPGIYTVHVDACAITTVLSVEVFGNTANAELTQPGPITLCPGEAMTLEALPGQVIYYWEPGQIFAPSITVDTTGVFLLVVADTYGCRDSLWTEVTLMPPYEALAFVDSAFCVGEPMIAVVTGDPSISWYNDPAQTNLIGSGNVLDLGIAQQSTTVWVEQLVGPCGSGSLEVDLVVSIPPEAPVISGPFTVCIGDSVTIAPQNGNALSYGWTTPTGTFSGAALIIDPVTMGAAGAYTVAAINAGCAPVSTTFQFQVNTPANFFIGNDTLICPGTMAQYLLPPGFVQPVWGDGSSQTWFATGGAGPVILTALDGNGCAVRDTAVVDVYAFIQPLAVTGSSICLGQGTTLLANGSGGILWYADAALLQQVHTGTSWSIAAPMSSITYYVTQSEAGCTSVPQPVELIVLPLPVDATVQAPNVICQGSSFTLELDGSGALNGTWITPAGTITGPTISVNAATPADAGPYMVVPYLNMCAGDTLVYLVSVTTPIPLDLGPDLEVCDGGIQLISIPAGFSGAIWSTDVVASSITVSQAGVYSVGAFDAQGCWVTDTIGVQLVPCDPVIPNVITPNGDGRNDDWQLTLGGFVGAQFRVYNRWGDVVWQGDVRHQSFRGRHVNGEPLSDGTYFYELLLTRANGDAKAMTGYITVLR